MTTDLEAEIRQVLSEQARLAVDVNSLGVDDDLFRAGMSSHASVNVMLALEDRFEIEFPDSMLTRGVFESISAIGTAVGELRGA